MSIVENDLHINVVEDVAAELKEMNEIASQNLKDKVREKWGRMIAIVSIVAIALGGLNDTMDAMEKIYDISLSQFTDIPSHNDLSRIYIRASDKVLEETFGAPIYIKKSASGDFIKYYQDRRFVLSVVTRDGAISAFIVFPKEGFFPNTIEHSGGERLLEQPFSANEMVSDIRVSFSRSVSYYIEENSSGDFSNLYSSISGYSEFLAPLDSQTSGLFSALSEGFMLGDDVTDPTVALRDTVTPNFYGYSILNLDVLEAAILTLSEYRLITQQ